MPVKECPLCGEVMRLKVRTTDDLAPDQSSPDARPVREWVCPECDHFEEVEEEGK